MSTIPVSDRGLFAGKYADLKATISLIVLAFVLAALSVAWKGFDLRNLSTVLIGDHYDSLSNASLVEQGIDNLLHRPTHLGYGLFFYNEKNPMAYTIAPYGIAVAVLPIYLVTGSNIDLTLNLYLLLTFSLSAWAIYLLARYLFDAPRAVAFLIGLVVGFCQFRFLYLYRIETLSTEFFFFSFYFLHRLLDDPRPRWAIALAVMFWFIFFTSGYFGFYFFLLAPLILLYTIIVRRKLPSVRLVKNIVLSAVVAAILFAPFLQFRLTSADTANAGTGIVSGYLVSSMINYAPRAIEWLGGTSLVRLLLRPYAGSRSAPIEVTLMIVAAFAWRFRHGRPGQDNQPQTEGQPTEGQQIESQQPSASQSRRLTTPQRAGLYGLLLVVAMFLAVGPWFVINDTSAIPSPYRLLAPLPGFSSIRNPNRAILIAVFCAAMLSAFVLTVIAQTVTKTRFRLIFILVTAAFIIEIFPSNTGLILSFRTDTNTLQFPIYSERPIIPYGAYAWLAQLPPGTPVLHVPADIDDNRLYMYAIHYHNQPMINGAASFYPFWYRNTSWNRFPDLYTMNLLQARGVQYVFVHTYLMGLDDYSLFQRQLRTYTGPLWLSYITTIDNVQIYKLVSTTVF